jgi:phage terminase large subunit GpA-like protein
VFQPGRKEHEDGVAGHTNLLPLFLAARLGLHPLAQQLPQLLLLPASGHSFPGQLTPEQGHLHLHLRKNKARIWVQQPVEEGAGRWEVWKRPRALNTCCLSKRILKFRMDSVSWLAGSLTG